MTAVDGLEHMFVVIVVTRRHGISLQRASPSLYRRLMTAEGDKKALARSGTLQGCILETFQNSREVNICCKNCKSWHSNFRMHFSKRLRT